jgi:hypothetical protein
LNQKTKSGLLNLSEKLSKSLSLVYVKLSTTKPGASLDGLTIAEAEWLGEALCIVRPNLSGHISSSALELLADTLQDYSYLKQRSAKDYVTEPLSFFLQEDMVN